MKKLLTLLLSCIAVNAMAQCSIISGVNLSFDNTCYRNLVTIDTIHSHHNLWQIGRPHKAAFDSALTFPNAIVTDTLLPYIANDTSVFYLKVPLSNGFPLNDIRFYYRTDVNPADTLRIDITADSVWNWKSLSDTGLPYSFFLFTPFDLHDSADWQPIILNRGLPPYLITSTDTVVLRFTFISAATVTGRNGWMIDSMLATYYREGAAPQLHNNANLFSVYPNPSHGNIYLHSTLATDKATITIYNTAGQQVYQQPAPQNGHLNLNLPNGIYTLRYSDEVEYCVKQIVIQN